MLTRLLLAAFLLAHAAIHAAYVSPRPPVTADGPAWPFELGKSWILGPLGINADTGRYLGIALIALTLCGFALAAMAVMGLGPGVAWQAGVVIGAVASVALLGLFFHPWLLLGVGIDIVVLWAVLVARWLPEGVRPD